MENIILRQLREREDEAYAAFQRKLIPTVPPESILGVRTPDLRKLAKSLRGSALTQPFLQTLPHTYFEENQLHAFLLSDVRDFDACLARVQTFLPYIDNWATCDQLSPAVFAKHKTDLLPHLSDWMQSEQTYVCRFGVVMLMRHFLDDAFDPQQPKAVAAIRTEDYYVHMAVAWYFATALAKQYDAVLPLLQTRTLDIQTHNKAIQKAAESYRIPPERKTYLKTLKIR